MELLWGLNETVHGKHLAQCLTYCECSINTINVICITSVTRNINQLSLVQETMGLVERLQRNFTEASFYVVRTVGCPGNGRSQTTTPWLWFWLCLSVISASCCLLTSLYWFSENLFSQLTHILWQTASRSPVSILFFLPLTIEPFNLVVGYVASLLNIIFSGLPCR